MQLKRIWEEKFQWLLVIWCGVALLLRPGWLLFGLGVILWGLLLYLSAPASFWLLAAGFTMDQEKAQAYLRKALACKPASPKPYINLALLTARRGAWPEAISLLKEAAEKTSRGLPPELRNVLAVCHRETGNYEEALFIIENLIQTGYRNGKVYFNLAFTQYKAGHLEEALKSAEKARTYNVSDPDPVLLSARIYFDRGDYATAKDNYEWCIKHTSWPVESYYWLGRCELELGLVDQACEHLATAVERIAEDPVLSDVPKEEAQTWLEKARALQAENGAQTGTEQTDPGQEKEDPAAPTPQATGENGPNRS